MGILEKQQYNLSLSKKTYGYKAAIDILDEEFSEFVDNKISIDEFFKIYHDYFYEISDKTHKKIIEDSINYLEGYVHPKEKTIEHLSDQLKQLQHQIDSTERHHPFFENGMVLLSKTYQSIDISSGTKYYMHSGKKRPILQHSVYSNIKKRLKVDKSDKEFIHFIAPNGLNAISTGPPINSTTDMFASIKSINVWPEPEFPQN